MAFTLFCLLACKIYFPVQQGILLQLNLRNKVKILVSLSTQKTHISYGQYVWTTDRSCTLYIWIHGLKITEVFKLSWKEQYVQLWKTLLMVICLSRSLKLLQMVVLPSSRPQWSLELESFWCSLVQILFFTAVTRPVFPHPVLNCFYPTLYFAFTILELYLFILDNFLHYQDHLNSNPVLQSTYNPSQLGIICKFNEIN